MRRHFRATDRTRRQPPTPVEFAFDRHGMVELKVGPRRVEAADLQGAEFCRRGLRQAGGGGAISGRESRLFNRLRRHFRATDRRRRETLTAVEFALDCDSVLVFKVRPRWVVRGDERPRDEASDLRGEEFC